MYSVRDDKGKHVKIGKIEGSKPREAPSPIDEKTRNSLEIKDIKGANADSKGLGVFEFYKRRFSKE